MAEAHYNAKVQKPPFLTFRAYLLNSDLLSRCQDLTLYQLDFYFILYFILIMYHIYVVPQIHFHRWNILQMVGRGMRGESTNIYWASFMGQTL